MAILDIDDTGKVHNSKKEDIPRRVFRTNEELKTSTIFSKDRKLDTIIRYIKGMKWSVDYFLQLRNLNDQLALPDLKLPPTIQKYHRISKLQITLQSSIDQGNLNTITGEATIDGGFLPNVHDVFLATLTGGRLALFNITEVKLETYNLKQIYKVSFKLFTFVDSDNDKLYNNMLFKVVKEYTYDKEHLLDYSAPVILRKDYNKKLNYKQKFDEVLDYYLTYFVNKDTKVIAPPTSMSVYTDNYLTEFFFKLVNQSDNNKLANVVKLSNDQIDTKVYTIWDAILSRNPDMLKKCTKRIGFKYMPYSFDSMITRQYNYMGISFVAMPLDNDEKPKEPTYETLKTYNEYVSYSNDDLSGLGDIHNSGSSGANIINYSGRDISNSNNGSTDSGDNSSTADQVKKKLRSPVEYPDDHYVLSKYFYMQNTKYCGVLENALLRYLRCEVQNTDELDNILEFYPVWSTKEQYYMLPIVLVLIKDAINNTFKGI